MKRAAAEILQIHLLDHAKRAAIPLGLTLWQQSEVRDLGSGE
jgi:hypothetical protein